MTGNSKCGEGRKQKGEEGIKISWSSFGFNLKGDSSVVGVRIGLVSWGSV